MPRLLLLLLLTLVADEPKQSHAAGGGRACRDKRIARTQKALWQRLVDTERDDLSASTTHPHTPSHSLARCLVPFLPPYPRHRPSTVTGALTRAPPGHTVAMRTTAVRATAPW